MGAYLHLKNAIHGHPIAQRELAEIEDERDRYKKALEIIADKSTACMTTFGTVGFLRAHAREALSGNP